MIGTRASSILKGRRRAGGSVILSLGCTLGVIFSAEAHIPSSEGIQRAASLTRRDHSRSFFLRRPSGQSSPGSEPNQCEACHARRDAIIVATHRQSTHGRMRLTCTSCHHGDPAASDQQKAHTAGFLGRPTLRETLTMCRPCHAQIANLLATSRHYSEREGIPRLDCVQCHGAHAIGTQPPNGSFAYTCAGCHGLEYLPALPPEFQTLLLKRDELTPLLPALAATPSSLPDDLLRRRREIRAGIAALVHATDTFAASRQIPTLLRHIEELMRLLEAIRKSNH